MKLTISIESEDDQAARYPRTVASTLLQVVAEKIYCDETEGALMDPNGNTIGKWEFTCGSKADNQIFADVTAPNVPPTESHHPTPAR